MTARFAFAAFLALALPCAAQLSEGERQLLQGAITAQSATEAGKLADAGMLRRIVALGDPALVRAFSRGMDFARIEQLPADIEAIVVAHFDDPRVGAALRAHGPRYRTRKLFDLHYARIQAAFKADEPSFKEILRTDQEGIDEALLRIAGKFPAPRDELPAVAIYVGTRQHPAGVPVLVSLIEQGYNVLGRVPPMHNRPLALLLQYPDPAVWRRASDELERLKREGRVTDAAYAAGREQLDRALADTGVTLARMRTARNRETMRQRALAMQPSPLQIEALKATDPRAYFEAQRAHLAKLDAVVVELGDESVGYQVGSDYLMLGLHARFKLRDARAAAELLEKSAAYHVAMGQVALADTYQLALKDRGAAIRAYEIALAEAKRPTDGRSFRPYAPLGHPQNTFWQAWLAQELEFARSGRPFAGRIPEPVVGGFFATLYGNANTLAMVIGDELPPLPPPQQDWSAVEEALRAIGSDGVSQALEQIPASRLVLFVGLPAMSALPAREMLRHLARNDPSGYWTACVMGTVAYLQSQPVAKRQDLAVQNGVARLLPGLAARGSPNALASASSQFLAGRGLRMKPEPR